MARLATAISRFLDRPDAERRLGPFVLVHQLGRGGFAPVWLAREVYGAAELRAAAVKLFALQRAEGGDGQSSGSSTGGRPARERIVEEARALCRVEHPNVVRFYALSIDEAAGVMGLAMEHVAGTALDARLAAGGPLAAADAIAVGIAVASALSAVHRAGLVHRDVKPSNVIESAGVYKLIDFGIASADALAAEEVPARSGPVRSARGVDPAGDTDAMAVTETRPFEHLAGTMGYIDPVCLSRGAPASPASDLYALGATLFECLTGVLPAVAAGEAHRDDVLEGRRAPPPLGGLAKDAPASLGRVVDALLDPSRKRRPTSAEQVLNQLAQVRAELAGSRRVLPPESVGPFRGLGRFEERDRGVYFGRAGDVAAALEVLRARGLAALVGSSGSGKSSLARAGVLPALAEGALGGWPAAWDTVIAEPGHDPRAAIADKLAGVVPDARLKEPDALVAALAERASQSGRGIVILVDQLEELATLAAGEESRAWAAALLGHLGESALPGVRAVVAARRDLLDPLLAMKPLARALPKGLILIEPITDLAWSEVLDQALAAYGYTFEDDALRGDLLAELAGTEGAMPLVQFALTELWNKRDAEAKRITRSGFAEIGGVAGALERHAEATLAEIAAKGAAKGAAGVLLALTTPEGTRATRSLADLERTPGAGREVIDALERARLVVAGAEGLTLAHEALLTRWSRLRAWVAEAREDRLLAGELERDAGLWRADPDAVPLWQRRRLAFGEELRRASLRLSPDALAFLKASRWAARRARLAVAGAGVVVGIALSILGLGYVRAVQERADVTRRSLLQVEEALDKEQESRRLADQSRAQAEEREGALKSKEAEVEDLLRRLEKAEDRETRRSIQEQLRKKLPRRPAALAAAEPAAPSPPTPAPPPPPAATIAPVAPAAPPIATSFGP